MLTIATVMICTGLVTGALSWNGEWFESVIIAFLAAFFFASVFG